jgi:hypothetical protein
MPDDHMPDDHIPDDHIPDDRIPDTTKETTMTVSLEVPSAGPLPVAVDVAS